MDINDKALVSFRKFSKASKIIQAIPVGKAEYRFTLLLSKAEMTNCY
jgi:hypothetical protein